MSEISRAVCPRCVAMYETVRLQQIKDLRVFLDEADDLSLPEVVRFIAFVNFVQHFHLDETLEESVGMLGMDSANRFLLDYFAHCSVCGYEVTVSGEIDFSAGKDSVNIGGSGGSIVFGTFELAAFEDYLIKRFDNG